MVALKTCQERGGMVEHWTPNREVLGLIPKRVTVLCPYARRINSLEYWLNPRKQLLSMTLNC